MADFETIRRSGSSTSTAEIDAGLRAHMNKVYGLMSAALLVTFGLAYFISSSEAALTLLFGSPLLYVVIFGPLAFVLVANFAFHKLSVAALNGIFWAYAGLTGASLATIFMMFSLPDVITGFLITSIAFLGLSITGYVTKRDLGPIHQIGVMMSWGLVAIGIGAFFFGGMGESMFFIMNIAVLAVFAILTATSTQEIKNTYLEVRHHNSPEAQAYLEKAAIIGSLQLYIAFIAMFRSIMFIFMGRE